MFHPKREMSDILGNESHQCRIGIDLGYNYTNETYNYRLFILLGFVLGIFREYLAKVSRYPGQSPGIEKPPGLMPWMVSSEVSAGGYTISILVFLFFIYQE